MLSLHTVAPGREFSREPAEKDGKPRGAYGGCSGGTKSLSRIEQHARLPFTLFAVFAETSVNGRTSNQSNEDQAASSFGRRCIVDVRARFRVHIVLASLWVSSIMEAA